MKAQIIIREYQKQDKAAVLNLLRLNTPAYFAVEEEKDFAHYLDHEIEFYYVVELEKQIVACGGINVMKEEGIGRISWDILHPDFQGKGIGKELLQYRLKKLEQIKTINTIDVRTTQLVYKFYEKSGFQLTEKVKDYWAPGFDLYHMVYKNSSPDTL